MKRRRLVIEKLVQACDAALHDRMYKDWPAIADLLMDAMEVGEREIEKMNREDALIILAVVVAIIAGFIWILRG